jgi:hypothetical protein
MTLQKFISRLNWRQIVIHFVASYFFVYAFTILAYLYDTKLVDHFRFSNYENPIQKIDNTNYSSSDVAHFIMIPLYSAMVGLLIAFLISLFISIKRQWFWFNSAIAFLLTYFLHRFDYLGWDYLKKIFLAPGRLFNNTFIEFLLNGTLMLTIGLLLFFLRQSMKFIDKNN